MKKYIVMTQNWWQGSNINIDSSFATKKEAQERADEIFDSDLKNGQNSWVTTKTAIKKELGYSWMENYNMCDYD